MTGRDKDDGVAANNNNNILLAIDVGSSSVRCSPYYYSKRHDKIDTTSVGGCSASIQRQGVEPITGNIRMNGLFEAVDSAVDEVLSKLRARFEDRTEKPTMDAVGFSTFAMNLIAVDAYGKLIPVDQNSNEDSPTTIGISYACNAPNVHAQCQRLRQDLGQDGMDKLYQATGAPLHSAYALPQLLALYNQENSPMNLQPNHRWQSIAGYCLSRWTNKLHLPITYSEASWTGLLNIKNCNYEESATQWLPSSCRASLPELTDFTDYIHGIPQFLDQDKTHTNPYWTKFPELRNAKFFLGIGDGACANIGSKCTTASRVAVTVGTSAAVRMCLPHPGGLDSPPLPFSIPENKGLFCYRIDRNHVLVGGALTDGGSIVEWAKRFLNLEKDESAFEKCLAETHKLVEAECQIESQASNRHRELIMAPFLSGERSTGFRDGAAGAIFGLTRETTPAHFFKSCLEGVSLRLKAIIDLMPLVVDKVDGRNTEDDGNENECTTLPVMVASGKAMEVNHLWRQMIADSCGLPVVLDKDTAEGTSRGVARLVAMSLEAENEKGDEKSGNMISLDFAKHEETMNSFLASQPRTSFTSMYKKKSRLQNGFIDSVAPFFSS